MEQNESTDIYGTNDSDGQNKTLERLYKTRIGIIKTQVEELMVQVTKEPDIYDVKLLREKLKVFSKEVHIYMEKVPNVNLVKEVVEHTTLQMKILDILNRFDSPPAINVQESSSRLPQLELTKFKGDILHWSQFWDRFSASVDSKNMKKVDKLAYLQACVEGEAKQAISGLETTETNYEIAVNTLKERFGKQYLVIDAHYRNLFALKRQNNSIKECRRLYNDIETNLRVLQTLGENVEGAHLRCLIIEKFPEDIIRELRMSDKNENMKSIREGLAHIITVRESTDKNINNQLIPEHFSMSVLNPRPNNVHSFKRKHSPLRRTADYKRPTLRCIFCNQSHYNDECPNVLSIKERKNKLRGKCYICFRKHTVQNYQMRKGCAHCKRQGHNRALCPIKFKYHKNEERTNLYHVNSSSITKEVILQTAVARVRTKEGSEFPVRILLDTGSQRSYITKDMNKKLNLQEREIQQLIVFTFGRETPQRIESALVDIEILTKRDAKRKIQANVVTYIAKGVPVCSESCLESVHNSYPDTIADDSSRGENIDILIGNDHYGDFVLNQTIKLKNNLTLINSHFGWLCSGKVQKRKENDKSMTFVTYCTTMAIQQSDFSPPDAPIRNDDIRVLWELDTIGITDSPKITQQEEVIKMFNDSIKFQDNRYFVQWPWAQYPPTLTSNFPLALGRLRSLINRMDDDRTKEYNDIFKQQIEDNIIEIVPSKQSNHPIHYLPHHGVKHPGKKLRIVFDASAKIKKENSLNECLYKGPLLLEDLTMLLINFRLNSIAIVADIEKAFLQIGLQHEDRDVTRFLWLNDIHKKPEDENLLHYRFCRVPFGVISSPFLLAATIHHHLLQSKDEIIRTIANKFYVDNLVLSTDDKNIFENIYTRMKHAFKEISMNLREWNSNSKEIMAKIPPEFKSKEKVKVPVLGMLWNTDSDKLNLKQIVNDKKNKTVPLTKRQILKITASVFDPLGMVAPILLPCKVFLQELWKENVHWDTPLTQEKARKWNEIEKKLEILNHFQLDRKLKSNEAQEIELHCFSDASKHAYSAVAYLRSKTKNDTRVSFVMCKSRLAPLKDKPNLQIPRLELLGFLISSRLLNYIKTNIDVKIERMFMWTDSQIVLSWMKSSKLLPPFIARRINQIKLVRDVEYRYIRTQDNPADMCTRLEGINDVEKWINGPQFLKREKTLWPREYHATFLLVGEGQSEPEREKDLTKELNSSTTQEALEATPQPSIIQSNPKRSSNDDTIRKIQEEYYPKEIKGEKTSLANSLDLFADKKGILRCKGRLSETSWKYGKKYPILIPGNCEFAQEEIKKIHEENYHVGTSHTLSLVREKYWIPKGRAQIQKVIRKCPQCIKHGRGPFKLPAMPPLPQERVSYSKPFTYIGLDYLGPLSILSEDENICKRWICLFTCLSVRAVHLELVQSLTAEDFLLSLRRMIAARGMPTMIVSDNATHFKLTENVLTGPYCVQNKVQWKFIPELAPWHGGFYERLVGLVKSCLKKTLDKHLLKETQMMTVIKEVEAVMNSRPLTYVGSEMEHVLRPVDFLTLGVCLEVEPSTLDNVEICTIEKENLIVGWKRGLMILREYIDMFTNQYLSSLRERLSAHKSPRINTKRVPRLGEIVQIKGDTDNRLYWKVGKIIGLLKGRDGEIRVAKVQVGQREFTRSISHLYPLEIDTDESKEREKTETNTSIRREQSTQERTTREAAKRANQLIDKWTKQLLN